MCCKNFQIYILKKICVYSTYSSFLVINVCNQGKALCSPCTVFNNPSSGAKCITLGNQFASLCYYLQLQCINVINTSFSFQKPHYCFIIWVSDAIHRDSHNCEHILSVIYYLSTVATCFQNNDNLFIQKQFILAQRKLYHLSLKVEKTYSLNEQKDIQKTNIFGTVLVFQMNFFITS